MSEYHNGWRVCCQSHSKKTSRWRTYTWIVARSGNFGLVPLMSTHCSAGTSVRYSRRNYSHFTIVSQWGALSYESSSLIHVFITSGYRAKGGELQSVLDRDEIPEEEDVVRFLRQVLGGLSFLHQFDIAHLDLKVSWIYLQSSFTCITEC